MIGLDAVGKTTILYKMKIGEVVTTIPTIGYNVESFELDGQKVTLWDVGGLDKIRLLWIHYVRSRTGFVFVVDSADIDRMVEAKDSLFKILLLDET